ncbi:MAG: hypothetical protein ACI9VR_004758 [Cognaticolwellia sp.]|jgi:hypothetical protein
MPPVLIGSGPCALRAAAAIPQVQWLDASPRVVDHPHLPVDMGLFEDHGTAGIVQELAGASSSVSLNSQILAKGRRLELPFRRRELARMLPLKGAQRALTDWTKTRANIRAREVIGGGHEQRCYRDWVVYRYGRALYEQIHAPYAERRFGDPDAVAIAVAKIHHGVTDSPGWARFGESASSAHESLLSHTQREAAEFEGVELQDGKVCAVFTDQGRVETNRLFWAGPIPELAEWLEGEVSEVMAVDMRRLKTRHRIEAFLPMPGAELLPEVLHIVDKAPFFRVTPVSMKDDGILDGVCCHIALDDGAPEWGMGDARLLAQCAEAISALEIGRADESSGLLRRMADYDPAWQVGRWFPDATRVTRALHEMGIGLVGRSAAYRWMDPGQSLRLARSIGEDPGVWHEALRTQVDPPIKLADEGVPVTRFIER